MHYLCALLFLLTAGNAFAAAGKPQFFEMKYVSGDDSLVNADTKNPGTFYVRDMNYTNEGKVECYDYGYCLSEGKGKGFICDSLIATSEPCTLNEATNPGEWKFSDKDVSNPVTWKLEIKNAQDVENAQGTLVGERFEINKASYTIKGRKELSGPIEITPDHDEN